MSFHCYLGASAALPHYRMTPVSKLIPDAIYLRLFHGRHTPDEELTEWGFDGPLIGPVELGMTYGTWRIHNPECTTDVNLPMHQDLVQFDGKFYGDLDVVRGETLQGRLWDGTPVALLTFDQFAERVRFPYPPNPALALAA